MSQQNIYVLNNIVLVVVWRRTVNNGCDKSLSVTCEEWMWQKLPVNNGCDKSLSVTCEQWMWQKLNVNNECDKSYLWTMDVTRDKREQWMWQKLPVNNECDKS